ncbi:hypothetical protein [Streptomyces sp. NPDC092370]|uniref:hypothetical protein n=1 Tax=Streptomyces sp. NPDC092370 TaxID=3366016 RepID=UPI0038119455
MNSLALAVRLGHTMPRRDSSTPGAAPLPLNLLLTPINGCCSSSRSTRWSSAIGWNQPGIPP